MDVSRMYDMIEKLSECAKAEFDKGMEHIDADEMGKVTDMLKDLAEAMYYRVLTEEMEEDSGRRFYDDYRYKTTGRFAPKGKGTYVGRHGYEEPPYWHMTPEMYRDMDKSYGRMYFTEPATMDGGRTESRYDTAKRHYTETRDMHRENTKEDKEHKMKALDEYIKELAGDITDMIDGMTAEEKALAKSKLSTLVTKM
nr:MAG TPA: hypothetical protein [Caudoviricetes sp.]